METIKLRYRSYSVTAYHRQGRADEKIVFLHGGGLDYALISWEEVISLLDDRYDVYAIDLLGYGLSEKPDIDYSIPMYVDFLYSILQQLKIEKTNLVGLSMGGGIGISFSLKYPQMVQKLVLVDAMGLFKKMPVHPFCCWYVNSWINEKTYDLLGKSRKLIRLMLLTCFISDKKKVTDELVDELFRRVQEPRYYRPWVSFERQEVGRKKMTTELTPRLCELNMPVLLVNGEKDSTVPAKSAVAASMVIKNSRLHIMKGCKHWAQKERPREFVEVLTDFLA
jgi:pimeloyl-ACP methyl ester carboxylesterase